MKLNDIECMHNDYHDAVKYYSTSTSWDHPSVSGGSNKHADRAFLIIFILTTYY